jgi:molecular chaperone GrpE (heat shock protein)
LKRWSGLPWGTAERDNFINQFPEAKIRAMIDFVLQIENPTSEDLKLARDALLFLQILEEKRGVFHEPRLFEKSWKIMDTLIQKNLTENVNDPCPSGGHFNKLGYPLQHGLELFNAAKIKEALLIGLDLNQKAYKQGNPWMVRCLGEEIAFRENSFEIFEEYEQAASAVGAPDENVEALAVTMLYHSIRKARAAEVKYAKGGGFHNISERLIPALDSAKKYLGWIDNRPQARRSTLTSKASREYLSKMIAIFEGLNVNNLGARGMDSKDFDSSPLEAVGIVPTSVQKREMILEIYSKTAQDIGSNLGDHSEIWKDLGKTWYSGTWY